MIRIAVVDDDSISCRSMVNYLNRYRKERQEELAVSVFTDGKAFADGYRPVYDILLLDIQMTPMDGIEVARRVRAHDESVVIVFITSAPQYAINGDVSDLLAYERGRRELGTVEARTRGIRDAGAGADELASRVGPSQTVARRYQITEAATRGARQRVRRGQAAARR